MKGTTPSGGDFDHPKESPVEAIVFLASTMNLVVGSGPLNSLSACIDDVVVVCRVTDESAGVGYKWTGTAGGNCALG